MPNLHYRVDGLAFNALPADEPAPWEVAGWVQTGHFTTFITSRLLPIPYAEAHFTRLKMASDYFDLPCPWQNVSDFNAAISRFVQQSDVSPAPKVLRITVAQLPHEHSPAVFYSLRPLPEPLASARLLPVAFERDKPLYKHIQLQAQEKQLQNVKMAGWDDYIGINAAGHLTESSYGNLFMIDKMDKLLTPNHQAGCLPGIMRQNFIQAAETLEMKVLQGMFTVNILDNIRGAFLTNAIRGITPIQQIGTVKWDISQIQPHLDAFKRALPPRNTI